MTQWDIDPAHTVAAFSCRHMKIANVRGQSNGVSGTIIFDPGNIAEASVRAEIEIVSLTTGIKKRDKHLLSADFLETAVYPRMTFISTDIQPSGGEQGKSNRRTLHGVTRPVILAALGGETTIGFSASTSINRFDFDVKWDFTLDGKTLVADREIRITIDVEADLVA